MTRVLVVDDHTTFAQLLGAALDREPDFLGVGHATDPAQAWQLCRSAVPDVVLMDVDLAGADGIALTRELRARWPDLTVVVLTAHSADELLGAAREAGAAAFLRKDGELSTLLGTLRRVRAGIPLPVAAPVAPVPGQRRTVSTARTPSLTDREREVLAMLGRGADVRGIARQLGITPHTSRGYVKSLLHKLDAHTQLEAVVTATRLGLLHLERDA